MKTLQSWFDAYSVSHQNRTNKIVHFICVPLIVFSLLGLLAAIPVGSWIDQAPALLRPYLHIGSLVLLAALVFYARLSIPMAIGFLLFALICLYFITLIKASDVVLWQFSFIIFAAGWIGQFIGHKIEGAKPSFLEDIKFLMIGPAWILGFIYKKLGLKY
jgi:uncharacterized membrane protein YGL010W